MIRRIARLLRQHRGAKTEQEALAFIQRVRTQRLLLRLRRVIEESPQPGLMAWVMLTLARERAAELGHVTHGFHPWPRGTSQADAPRARNSLEPRRPLASCRPRQAGVR